MKFMKTALVGLVSVFSLAAAVPAEANAQVDDNFDNNAMIGRAAAAPGEANVKGDDRFDNNAMIGRAATKLEKRQ